MKKFALLMALMLMLGTLVACGEKPADTTEGETTGEAETGTGEVLTGSADGFNGPIEVEVTKDGDTITDVKIVTHEESVDEIEEVKTAIETLPAAIVEANGTEGVEAVSGATYSSEGIINAVNTAIGQ